MNDDDTLDIERGDESHDCTIRDPTQELKAGTNPKICLTDADCEL